MKIYPIKTGSIYCDKGKTITQGVDLGKMIYVPSFAWLINTGSEYILVDTGMCSSTIANKNHYKGSIQESDERIDRALKKRGISPNKISKVILTHLHWDHSQNLDKFKNAEFFVQKKELAFARSPTKDYYRSYDSPKLGLSQSFRNIRFTQIDGNKEIVPGVSVLLTPGHSPGHQVVLVKTSKGVYAIAGDAIMSFENIKPKQKIILTGRHQHSDQARKAIQIVLKNADYILPGHESKILRKKVYP